MSNYNILPSGGYGMIQRWVMKMPKLSIQAKAIYALLCSYTGDKEFCYPTIKRIGEDIGLSKNRVMEYLKELEKNKLIKKEKRFGDSRRHNKYYVLFLSKKPQGIADNTSKVPSAGPSRSGQQDVVQYNNNILNNNNLKSIGVSEETHNLVSGDSSKKEDPPEEQKESPSCKIVEYWNSKPNLTRHKKTAKTYTNAARLVRLFRSGKFGRMYHIDEKYGKQNNIKNEDLKKRWTAQEIMQAIDKFDLMCSPTHGQEFRDKYPKSFESFLYNKMTKTSFFLSVAKCKKPPLKKFEKILDEEIYKLYRASFFRGKELNTIEEAELIRGVNFVVRRQREYHKTIGRYFTPFAFRGKEFYRNHVNFLIDEYFDKRNFDVTKIGYQNIWKKYIIYMKQTRGSELDLNPSAIKVRKAKAAFERSKNIA